MTDILHVKNVSYGYPKGDHLILKDISFVLNQGEIACLLGSNGCGKSTLLKLLAGELPLRTGQIVNKELKRAYISQDLDQTLFTELTLEENLKLLNIAFADTLAQKKFLDDYHPKLFGHLHNLLGTLSGGEKQAFALAVTLYYCPDFLLLDEHTSALDPEAEQRLMDITYRKIKEYNITALMCTHKVDLVTKYADHILGINKGKIVLDVVHTPPQALSPQQLENIYF